MSFRCLCGKLCYLQYKLFSDFFYILWREERHAQQQMGITVTYSDATISVVASQITSISTVSLTVCSGAHQRKHNSSASLAFEWGIHRWPVDSSHKWPITWKKISFDDGIMRHPIGNVTCTWLHKMCPLIMVSFPDEWSHENCLAHLRIILILWIWRIYCCRQQMNENIIKIFNWELRPTAVHFREIWIKIK